MECMAVHKSCSSEKEVMELWIGSGDSSGHSQISWLNLIDDGKTVINQCNFNGFFYEILKIIDAILCITVIVIVCLAFRCLAVGE